MAATFSYVRAFRALPSISGSANQRTPPTEGRTDGGGGGGPRGVGRPLRSYRATADIHALRTAGHARPPDPKALSLAMKNRPSSERTAYPFSEGIEMKVLISSHPFPNQGHSSWEQVSKGGSPLPFLFGRDRIESAPELSGHGQLDMHRRSGRQIKNLKNWSGRRRTRTKSGPRAVERLARGVERDGRRQRDGDRPRPLGLITSSISSLYFS